MAKDINNSTFDESTKLKLGIFGECFREWLPVFLYTPFVESVCVFDFFAGSGTDADGSHGSPLVLLEEARGENRKYCLNAEKNIDFLFNEGNRSKSLQLKQTVDDFVCKCQQENQCESCVYQRTFTNLDFQDVFQNDEIQSILSNKKIGKFLLLDQYGFKHIDDTIFKQLVGFPKTDFIFFISSSFISRFREHPNTTAHINTQRINFDETRPIDCHRAIASYFRDLIPANFEYYLHHFTIQKESNRGNYYGLIFGSSHTLGMEKFLKVCWQKDLMAGESNCNIDNDFQDDTLFYNPEVSNKRQTVKEELKRLILDRKIVDNISGFKYVLKNGCEPKLFTEVVKQLEAQKRIQRTGNLNYSSSNVHTIKRYEINVCKNK